MESTGTRVDLRNLDPEAKEAPVPTTATPANLPSGAINSSFGYSRGTGRRMRPPPPLPVSGSPPAAGEAVRAVSRDLNAELSGSGDGGVSLPDDDHQASADVITGKDRALRAAKAEITEKDRALQEASAEITELHSGLQLARDDWNGAVDDLKKLRDAHAAEVGVLNGELGQRDDALRLANNEITRLREYQDRVVAAEAGADEHRLGLEEANAAHAKQLEEAKTARAEQLEADRAAQAVLAEGLDELETQRGAIRRAIATLQQREAGLQQREATLQQREDDLQQREADAPIEGSTPVGGAADPARVGGAAGPVFVETGRPGKRRRRRSASVRTDDEGESEDPDDDPEDDPEDDPDDDPEDDRHFYTECIDRVATLQAEWYRLRDVFDESDGRFYRTFRDAAAKARDRVLNSASSSHQDAIRVVTSITVAVDALATAVHESRRVVDGAVVLYAVLSMQNDFLSTALGAKDAVIEALTRQNTLLRGRWQYAQHMAAVYPAVIRLAKHMRANDEDLFKNAPGRLEDLKAAEADKATEAVMALGTTADELGREIDAATGLSDSALLAATVIGRHLDKEMLALQAAAEQQQVSVRQKARSMQVVRYGVEFVDADDPPVADAPADGAAAGQAVRMHLDAGVDAAAALSPAAGALPAAAGPVAMEVAPEAARLPASIVRSTRVALQRTLVAFGVKWTEKLGEFSDVFNLGVPGPDGNYNIFPVLEMPSGRVPLVEAQLRELRRALDEEYKNNAHREDLERRLDWMAGNTRDERVRTRATEAALRDTREGLSALAAGRGMPEGGQDAVKALYDRLNAMQLGGKPPPMTQHERESMRRQIASLKSTVVQAKDRASGAKIDHELAMSKQKQLVEKKHADLEEAARECKQLEGYRDLAILWQEASEHLLSATQQVVDAKDGGMGAYVEGVAIELIRTRMREVRMDHEVQEFMYNVQEAYQAFHVAELRAVRAEREAVDIFEGAKAIGNDDHKDDGMYPAAAAEVVAAEAEVARARVAVEEAARLVPDGTTDDFKRKVIEMRARAMGSSMAWEIVSGWFSRSIGEPRANDPPIGEITKWRRTVVNDKVQEVRELFSNDASNTFNADDMIDIYPTPDWPESEEDALTIAIEAAKRVIANARGSAKDAAAAEEATRQGHASMSLLRELGGGTTDISIAMGADEVVARWAKAAGGKVPRDPPAPVISGYTPLHRGMLLSDKFLAAEVDDDLREKLEEAFKVVAVLGITSRMNALKALHFSPDGVYDRREKLADVIRRGRSVIKAETTDFQKRQAHAVKAAGAVAVHNLKYYQGQVAVIDKETQRFRLQLWGGTRAHWALLARMRDLVVRRLQDISLDIQTVTTTGVSMNGEMVRDGIDRVMMKRKERLALDDASEEKAGDPPSIDDFKEEIRDQYEALFGRFVHGNSNAIDKLLAFTEKLDPWLEVWQVGSAENKARNVAAGKAGEAANKVRQLANDLTDQKRRLTKAQLDLRAARAEQKNTARAVRDGGGGGGASSSDPEKPLPVGDENAFLAARVLGRFMRRVAGQLAQGTPAAVFNDARMSYAIDGESSVRQQQDRLVSAGVPRIGPGPGAGQGAGGAAGMFVGAEERLAQRAEDARNEEASADARELQRVIEARRAGVYSAAARAGVADAHRGRDRKKLLELDADPGRVLQNEAVEHILTPAGLSALASAWNMLRQHDYFRDVWLVYVMMSETTMEQFASLVAVEVQASLNLRTEQAAQLRQMRQLRDKQASAIRYLTKGIIVVGNPDGHPRPRAQMERLQRKAWADYQKDQRKFRDPWQQRRRQRGWRGY